MQRSLSNLGQQPLWRRWHISLPNSVLLAIFTWLVDILVQASKISFSTKGSFTNYLYSDVGMGVGHKMLTLLDKFGKFSKTWKSYLSLSLLFLMPS